MPLIPWRSEMGMELGFMRWYIGGWTRVIGDVNIRGIEIFCLFVVNKATVCAQPTSAQITLNLIFGKQLTTAFTMLHLAQLHLDFLKNALTQRATERYRMLYMSSMCCSSHNSWNECKFEGRQKSNRTLRDWVFRCNDSSKQSTPTNTSSSTFARFDNPFQSENHEASWCIQKQKCCQLAVLCWFVWFVSKYILEKRLMDLLKSFTEIHGHND